MTLNCPILTPLLFNTDLDYIYEHYLDLIKPILFVVSFLNIVCSYIESILVFIYRSWFIFCCHFLFFEV